MTYAADTSVSVAKSRGEIEDMVQRAGGQRFASMYEPAKAMVLFELGDRRIMFELPLPSREAFESSTKQVGNNQFRKGEDRVVRNAPEQQNKLWEQACRSKWRALALTIKAKLVSVESGVETFEDAFLAQIVVPTADGARRFGELATKAIHQAYTGGTLPPLLGSGR